MNHTIKAKNKKTGEVVGFKILEKYVIDNNYILDKEEFNDLFEVVEDKNIGIGLNHTCKDTGNIGIDKHCTATQTDTMNNINIGMSSLNMATTNTLKKEGWEGGFISILEALRQYILK